MATIDADAGIMTLINTFHVDPADADRLIALLFDATEQVMRGRPGYISANVHKSADGTRVINYAQWRTPDHFEAMRADPKAQAHMKQCAEIATRIDPVVCTVSWSDEAD